MANNKELVILNSEEEQWKGGEHVSPFRASYGKIMMWYFLVSDTFTFVAFLLAYAGLRFANSDVWPVPSEVFQSFPGIADHGLPLMFVSFMTFILILSSVTMVRAVQEGMMMNQKGVVKWLLPTIVGGIIFLGCQYLEWSHLIHEGMYFDFANMTVHNPFSNLGNVAETGVWGPQQFAMCFFVVTGFHGLHVLTGVILNIWLVLGVAQGKYQKLGHYEMVEKIGLFWHFVDLVWVLVFLCFYLL